jgi:hypothetical protein
MTVQYTVTIHEPLAIIGFMNMRMRKVPSTFGEDPLRTVDTYSRADRHTDRQTYRHTDIHTHINSPIYSKMLSIIVDVVIYIYIHVLNNIIRVLAKLT